MANAMLTQTLVNRVADEIERLREENNELWEIFNELNESHIVLRRENNELRERYNVLMQILVAIQAELANRPPVPLPTPPPSNYI